MKKYLSEKYICRIFNFLSCIMFFFLFHYSLELIGKNTDNIMDEVIYFYNTSILLNLLKLVIAIVLLYFMNNLSKLLCSPKRKNILLGIMCLISAVFSIYWVAASGTAPYSDQGQIVQCAVNFNNGNFDEFLKGNYVSTCPQQLGIITFLRILFIIFGEGNFYAFQYFTALTIPIIVFSGCMIVRIITSENTTAEVFYLFFITTCFPMYAFTAFVYGDLCTVPFAMLAIMGFLSCLKKFSWVKLVFTSLALGFSILIRVNSYIVLIALLIVVFIKFINTKDFKMLIIGVGLIFGVLIFQLSLKIAYKPYYDPDAEAIPAYAYVIMGQNDDFKPCAGWCNQFHIKVFSQYDYNEKAARGMYLAFAKIYINHYREHPDFMVDFFTRKINSQWNAPMYQCITMNRKVVNKQTNFVAAIYEGKTIKKVIEFYAAIFQRLIYMSILYLLVSKRKKITDISYYAMLIVVFGGFIFSIIWEAKTRYTLPYLIMMIPYMAIGLSAIIDDIHTKISSLK